MSNVPIEHHEIKAKELAEAPVDANPTTKLERRRRIEDLFEEKRLREELGEFDLL